MITVHTPSCKQRAITVGKDTNSYYAIQVGKEWSVRRKGEEIGRATKARQIEFIVGADLRRI